MTEPSDHIIRASGLTAEQATENLRTSTRAFHAMSERAVVDEPTQMVTTTAPEGETWLVHESAGRYSDSYLSVTEKVVTRFGGLTGERRAYQCERCGALVSNTVRHDAWHRSISH